MDLITGLLAAEGDKHSPVELLILAVLPLVLAIVLYRYAKFRAAQGGKRVLLWASLVPLIAGALLALRPLSDINSQVYRDFYYISDKSKSLHYASFFVPAGCTVLFAGLILYGNYRERMEQ